MAALMMPSYEPVSMSDLDQALMERTIMKIQRHALSPAVFPMVVIPYARMLESPEPNTPMHAQAAKLQAMRYNSATRRFCLPFLDFESGIPT